MVSHRSPTTARWHGRLALGLIAASLPISAARAQDGRWTVAPSSLLYVQVFNDESRVGSGFAHDHVIRAGEFSGVIAYDPEHLEACRLHLEVPAAGLVVDEPALRSRLGYEGVLDEEQRRDVRESMLAEDQLDADRYPTIYVNGRGCQPLESGRVRAAVTVRIRGREVRRTVILRLNETTDGLRIRGRFQLRHADFGMEPYTAFLGSVANAEPIRFVADIRALPSR